MRPRTPSKGPALEGGFRTEAERVAGARLKEVFERCPDPWEKKMEAFPKYVKRQNITRLLAQYEVFKRILPVKGSIVECGVFRGATLMAWAHLSAILEPVNLTRRIYGFDSFEGFPAVSKKDRARQTGQLAPGALYSDSHDELKELLQVYDSTRFLGHVPKVQLIKGDATKTIPDFLGRNQHLVVSLLFMDFDLYGPTRVALEHFVPRMPKGAILAFDELDNPLWPGETRAMLEHFAGRRLALQRIEFDPYIGFAVLK